MLLKSVMLLFLSVGALACNSSSEGVSGQRTADSGRPSTHEDHDSSRSAESVDSRELYEAHGTVLWFEEGRVYLNHEEMPGFMDAMAMGFDVRDSAVLEGIEPGTTVHFRVIVEPETFYIDQIQPVE